MAVCCVTQLVARTSVGMGRDSSIGITTGYGLDGPGIDAR
jgi:hypothetical protein